MTWLSEGPKKKALQRFNAFKTATKTFEHSLFWSHEIIPKDEVRLHFYDFNYTIRQIPSLVIPEFRANVIGPCDGTATQVGHAGGEGISL